MKLVQNEEKVMPQEENVWRTRELNSREKFVDLFLKRIEDSDLKAKQTYFFSTGRVMPKDWVLIVAQLDR